jgi:copper chaperone CopZ
VQALDAAAQVNIDLAQRKVSVQSSAALDQIVAAIDGAGYPVISKATV